MESLHIIIERVQAFGNGPSTDQNVNQLLKGCTIARKKDTSLSARPAMFAFVLILGMLVIVMFSLPLTFSRCPLSICPGICFQTCCEPKDCGPGRRLSACWQLRLFMVLTKLPLLTHLPCGRQSTRRLWQMRSTFPLAVWMQCMFSVAMMFGWHTKLSTGTLRYNVIKLF